MQFIEDTAVANGWPRNLANKEMRGIEKTVELETLNKMRDPVKFEEERQKK